MKDCELCPRWLREMARYTMEGYKGELVKSQYRDEAKREIGKVLHLVEIGFITPLEAAKIISNGILNEH